MKIIIKETNEIMDLTILDERQEWTQDLIMYDDNVEYDMDNNAIMDRATFDFWNEYIKLYSENMEEYENLVAKYGLDKDETLLDLDLGEDYSEHDRIFKAFIIEIEEQNKVD